MSIVHPSGLEEFKKIIKEKPKVVVDFFATWCGPCIRIAPVYKKFAETYPEVTFVKVDVDEENEIAQDCKIRAMPTFKFYKDGELHKSFEGASQEKLEETIKEL
ncbi:thioredoxin-like protein [Anaeramoeba flamelloides]|uniref:Thioredoxin n=1 Tax=Anaeramoeba flamelloides TaxID=1746091 RepID=A0AAV7ZDH6_9EUKA|nr:thioredoxin-like protein [Anaeramoeba flamelloides]|eukprot:Anaeramoba_flamelloidesa93300_633.p1 GENE.a93300_633~~a93300_633.p1  ORF type:complete len:111 (+),score=25.37 a93300_633:24-335(+)